MAKPTVSPARVAAFNILRKVEDGAFSSVLLANAESELKPVDRSLCHELVLGVLRWQLFLDRIIEHLTRRKVDSLDFPVLLALRLGIYQLRFLSRVPASAVVNESVNLVSLARLGSAKAFVNAVLRRATRESSYDPGADVSDDVERIAVQTSHPQWLIERWRKSFGVSETESFARANNEVPPTSFRVVRTRADQTRVLDRLQQAGALVEPSLVTQGAWRVSGATSVVRELAASGEIYVQDEASQLVANAVQAEDRQRVLDLCAAPGGKTTQIAGNAESALIVAADLSLGRLHLVKQAAEVQRIDNVKLLQLDATHSLPFTLEAFDRVLVDAPCSGTGTLRRNPEIRWRLREEDIEVLSLRQKRILANAAAVVKTGGRLIYSTCSVELEENEHVVSDFLSTHPQFRPAANEQNGSADRSSIRTWPHRDGSDGFFLAAFEKA